MFARDMLAFGYAILIDFLLLLTCVFGGVRGAVWMNTFEMCVGHLRYL